MPESYTTSELQAMTKRENRLMSLCLRQPVEYAGDEPLTDAHKLRYKANGVQNAGDLLREMIADNIRLEDMMGVLPYPDPGAFRQFLVKEHLILPGEGNQSAARCSLLVKAIEVGLVKIDREYPFPYFLHAESLPMGARWFNIRYCPFCGKELKA